MRKDYYPFGMGMPGRQFSAGSGYRYGFNAQEKSDEISESGNGYTAPYWEYDSRIGKRWNTDPKPVAWESNYAVNGNNPLFYLDPLGDFKTKFGATLYRFFHGGKVGFDKLHKEWYVGKKIEYEGSGVGVAIRPRFDWNGSGRPYTGSGWGHGARSLVASFVGIDGRVSGLWGLGFHSMFQYNKPVQFSGEILEQIKRDPDIKRIEDEIVEGAKRDMRYGKEAFSFPYVSPAQLGGDRGSLNPLDPSSMDTWKVGFNPLTYAVRSVTIKAQVEVSAAGAMHITFSFTDNLDLRPERGGKIYMGGDKAPFAAYGEKYAPNLYGGGHRPFMYNVVSSVLGVPYHDIFGGNDKMKTTATWTSDK